MRRPPHHPVRRPRHPTEPPGPLRRGLLRAAAALLAVVPLTATALVPPAAASSWPSAGRDAANSRSNPEETAITAATASGLRTRWARTLAGTAAATPAVLDNRLYVPDTSGAMSALDTANGEVIWSRPVSSYTGTAGDYSRATPAVTADRLVFGTRRASASGAKVVAARTWNGDRLWVTTVDTHPAAIITGAPVIAGGVVYVGVSSGEEVRPTCCTFRGSVVALDAATGRLLWKTPTVPVGYTGGAVWSSSPAVDTTAGLVYVTTGNNYSVPAGVCTAPGQTGCAAADPRNYTDAVLALRTSDGSPAWALRTLSADVWTTACRQPGSPPCGPDWDFGSGPNLFTATVGGTSRTLVGAGQKSGIYWVADARTGALVWQRRVGPGGDGGGIQWGTATDGRRIYVAVANTERLTYTLPSGRTVDGGSVAALDPATGRILWQVPDPQGAPDAGFVTVANGVVYAGSSAASGANMLVLDAATGRSLTSFSGTGPVVGGAAVVDASVFWAGGGASSTLRSFGLLGSVPSVPTRVAATAGAGGRVTLTWSPPASGGASAVTGYRVARDGSDALGTGRWSTVVPATARSFTFGSLVPGRTYTVSVTAINGHGLGTAAPVRVTAVP